MQGTGRPLCFSKEVFTRKDFSVDEFLANCRGRVPLESVLKDLKEYTVNLDFELVEIINKDYADFVNLSSNLVGIDNIIVELRYPLLQLRKDVSVTLSALNGTIDVLEKKLSERKEIAKKKAVLQLFLNISKTLTKIEKLLHLQDEKPTDIDLVLHRTDEESSNLIERVATEYNQLKFYVNKGKGLPYVNQVESRVVFIEKTLQDALEHLFREVLVTEANRKNLDIVSNCLRTYVAIDKMREPEKILRNSLKVKIQPLINDLNVDDSNRRGGEGLSKLFTSLLLLIEKECGFLLDITHKQIRGFNFLSNSIWVEITEQLIIKTPQIFSPAFPDLFHRNYTIYRTFVEKAETSFCHSRSELSALTSSAPFKELEKKWNVDIYFKLRLQTIARQVESSLGTSERAVTTTPSKMATGTSNLGSTPSTPSVSPTPLQFPTRPTDKDWLLPSTFEVWCGLFACWSPGIFLLSLGDQFFKLSLQLLCRYKNWLTAGLTYVNTNTANALNSSTPQPGTTPTLPSSTLSASNSVSLTNGNLEESGWATQLTSDQYIRLLSDVEQLLARLRTDYLNMVRKCIPNSPGEEFHQVIRSSVQEWCADVATSFLPSLESHVLEPLINSCRERLKPMDGIVSTYRMTNKPPPTRHSYFVENILVPLREFFDGLSAFPQIKEKRVGWALVVVSSVTDKYADMASQLLNRVTKQNMLISNLKMANKSRDQLAPAPTGGAASSPSVAVSGTLSDIDKMALQLYLDVREFGNEIAKLGVSLHTLESYKVLKQIVSGAERFFTPHPSHAHSSSLTIPTTQSAASALSHSS